MTMRQAMRVICGLAAFWATSFWAALAPADPFIGEIRWVAFDFAPSGWASCNGQTLQIAQYPALYSLLGASFGGDGIRTFKLPDLRGRAPVHVNATAAGYSLGSAGGAETHQLVSEEIPLHFHSIAVDPREATSSDPAGKVLAKTSDGGPAYCRTNCSNSPAGIVLTGGGSSQPHQNMKPFVTLNCIIALQGLYPIRP